MKKLFVLATTTMVSLSLSGMVSAAAYKSEKEKVSYAIGIQLGTSLKRSGISDLDYKVMTQAIQDAVSGAELKVSPQEMQAAMQSLQKKQMEERKAQGEQAKKKGAEFLEKNKKEKGIKTTQSGIQYKVVTEGKGAKPQATDRIVAHYEGTLIDGTVFDSSYKRGQPATFPVNQVIKGWQEIIPMMPLGSKWKVYIPSDLAYGERGAPPNIGPNETLIFNIELIELAK